MRMCTCVYWQLDIGNRVRSGPSEAGGDVMGISNRADKTGAANRSLSDGDLADRPCGRGEGLRGLVFLCASGGVGLTTLVALVAKSLAGRSHVCALADLDLTGGGMDVLLGIEGVPGLRLEQIRAPLGRMDSRALMEELPVWDGIPVLSNDPWNGPAPGWWDMDAALKAMSGFAELLLVDAGRGTGLRTLRSIAGLPRVLLVDMTVLGLARARSLLAGSKPPGGVNRETADAHESSDAHWAGQVDMGRGRRAPGSTGRDVAGGVPAGSESGGANPIDVDPLVVIGVRPHVGRSSDLVGQDEAADFLGLPLICVLKPEASLAGSVQSGLGLRKIPRSYQKALKPLIDVIEDSLPFRSGGIGG